MQKQSATFEEAEPLGWDNEDGKFMEIMPKGKITSEMYDKMFGDDSVPHYTGKTPPKQITLETFRNETGDLPVKDVKYYLSKNHNVFLFLHRSNRLAFHQDSYLRQQRNLTP